MVKSVSSFEIYKITSFSIYYPDKITVLPILTKIKFLAFSRVLHKVSVTLFKVLQSENAKLSSAPNKEGFKAKHY